MTEQQINDWVQLIVEINEVGKEDREDWLKEEVENELDKC